MDVRGVPLSIRKIILNSQLCFIVVLKPLFASGRTVCIVVCGLELMRTPVPLSDAAVRNANPADTTHTLSDSGVLCLHVMPKDSKLWRYRCRWFDKRSACSNWPILRNYSARFSGYGESRTADWNKSALAGRRCLLQQRFRRRLDPLDGPPGLAPRRAPTQCLFDLSGEN